MPPSTPEEVAQHFASSINARDLPAALSLWADDAVIVTADGQPLAGKAQIASALEALMSNGTRLDVEISHLYLTADVAVATGVLTMTSDGEHAFEARSHSTVVYRRTADGAWRIALDAPWGLPSAGRVASV